MTIRITGDGPKITATGSGSTVLVEISTGQHDPGSFSGVHNDLTGRSTTGAHVGTAVSIDPTGFAGNLDGTIVNAQLLAAAVDDLTTGGGGGGGVTDHGLLTGLSDDDHTQYAKKASNLSDLASAATARTNLGLGTAAVAATGDFDAAGTAAGLVDDLSGVSNQATARTNLGLGTAAVTDTGTGSSNVILGNDARLTDSRTPTSHNHAASEITSGTIDQARLGSGSAGAGAKFLADDQTYKTVSSGIADPGGANDDFLQRKAGAWAARTIAQVQTDLKVEPVRHRYIHNQYHVLVRMNQDRSDSNIYAPGANVVAAKLVEIVEPVQLSGRWFHVEASTASAVFRPGLYASSDSTGLPTGSPLLTTPAVDASSTGYKLDTFTASSTLQPGYYWEITASSHGTAGWRGGPTYSIADMGHTSGGAIANRSFTSSWSYSSGGLPDVSAFTWTASVSLHAPLIRWRTERV